MGLRNLLSRLKINFVAYLTAAASVFGASSCSYWNVEREIELQSETEAEIKADDIKDLLEKILDRDDVDYEEACSDTATFEFNLNAFLQVDAFYYHCGEFCFKHNPDGQIEIRDKDCVIDEDIFKVLQKYAPNVQAYVRVGDGGVCDGPNADVNQQDIVIFRKDMLDVLKWLTYAHQIKQNNPRFNFSEYARTIDRELKRCGQISTFPPGYQEVEFDQEFYNGLVAAVLAHEMGHIKHNHVKEPCAPANEAACLKLSRQREFEADEYATRLLVSTCSETGCEIDPVALLYLFSFMGATDKSLESNPLFKHPSNYQRFERTKKILEKEGIDTKGINFFQYWI